MSIDPLGWFLAGLPIAALIAVATAFLMLSLGCWLASLTLHWKRHEWGWLAFGLSVRILDLVLLVTFVGWMTAALAEEAG